jgi:hypothetical protein
LAFKRKGGKKMKFLRELFLFMLMGAFLISSVNAESGMAAFQNSTTVFVSKPQYQTWDDISFSASNNATNVQGTIRWLVLKSNVVRKEQVLGTLDGNSALKIQFYNSSDSWTQADNITLTSSVSTTRSFDIAIEQESGEVLVAYNNGTAGLFDYKVWNGASWYKNGSVTLNLTEEIKWIKMASRPYSNEIMLIVADANSELDAVFWNGTDWGSSYQLETSLKTNAKEDFDVEFEDSGDALIVWAHSATAALKYITYSNSIWSPTSTAPVSEGQAAKFQWIRLRNYPNTDRIMLCNVDADSDLNCLEWTGNSWGITKEIDSDIEYVSGKSFRNFDIVPETSSNSFLVMYGNAGNDYFSTARCFGQSNCQAGIWEANHALFSGVDIGANSSWASLSFDPENPGKITAIMIDQMNLQWRARISCTNSVNSCSADELPVLLAKSSNKNYESAMFVYQGIRPVISNITTNPVIAASTLITITANGVGDLNNNTLNLYCSSSSTTPSSSDTICTEGNTSQSFPYPMTCSYNSQALGGNYTTYCRIYDGNYYSTSVNVSYQVDSTAPIITILSPANASYNTANFVLINITSNEALSWAGYSLNGDIINLAQATADNWFGTINLNGEASYNLTIYANDTSENQRNTNMIFFVDTSAPRLINPVAMPNPANESQNVICNVYVNDTFGLASVKIAEDATIPGVMINHTIDLFLSGWANYTILNAAKGKYTCIFYAKDLAGNSNSGSLNFTVGDVIPPSIILNSPLNQTYSTNSILLSISLNENATGANYSLDGAANVSLTGSGTSWSRTINSSDGEHYIIFYAVDSSGNLGTSTAVYFFVVSPALQAIIQTQTIYNGGGGGWSEPTQVIKGGSESIAKDSKIELIGGTEGEFTINVYNNYPNSFLENLTLSLSGFSGGDFLVTPDKISKIAYNETRQFNIKIRSFNYTDYAEYNLNALIKGKIIKYSMVNNYTEFQLV